jgi:hypothetical protein
MALFDSLGFAWDRGSIPRQLPRASVKRTTFQFARMLPEYVWNAGVLEGNPLTFPEVKTLLDGVTVGGRSLSDQEQILNLAHSSKCLLDLVRRGEFALDKTTFCALHALIACDESVTGRLDAAFAKGLAELRESVPNPFERATAFFLFGSLRQIFARGNRHTLALMMNGALMTEGVDAISIPAMQAAEFNSRMVEFHATRDGTRIMRLALEYHPEFSRICELNPELSLIRTTPEIRVYRIDEPPPRSNRPL